MSEIHVPLAEARATLATIPDTTDQQKTAALAYLIRTGNTDCAAILGLGGVA